MRTLFVLSLLLCSLTLLSCAPPEPNVAEVRKAIEEMTAQMAEDMKAGVVDTTLARYTDDAISLPNFGPAARGKAEILASYKKMMEMDVKMLEVDFTVTDVEVGGKYAYEIGTYDMTISMMGMPPAPEKGKYLTVWERGTDGTWRIKVETWNTDMPPAMPDTDDDEDEDDKDEDQD